MSSTWSNSLPIFKGYIIIIPFLITSKALVQIEYWLTTISERYSFKFIGIASSYEMDAVERQKD